MLDYVRERAAADDPAAVIAAMDEFALKQRWLMNIGPNKGEILLEAMASVAKPDGLRMLELGAYCGYSAVLAGSQLKACDGKLISVEKSRHCSEVARQVVEHAGLSQTVTIINSVLEDCIAQFTEPFDIVLLDHWKDRYLPDLILLEQAGLLDLGSVVVADNIDLFDVADYLRHVRDSGLFDSVFHESKVEYKNNIKDGVEVSVLIKRPAT